MPKGLNVNFNLAIDVNDQELVTKIERILDDQGSRILDTLYIKSQSLEIFLEEQHQKLIVRLRELYPEEEVRVFIRKVKDDCKERIKDKEETMKKKLCSLRERFKTGRLPPGWKTGSRKIKAFYYIREHSGALPGARFPHNLRPHGRRRPHRNRYPEKSQHQVTEAELAARDPIILTKNPNFELPACGKELMRLGPKTCPTPAGPTDEKALYEAFVQFRETIRWKWYHNKNVKPEDVDESHKSQPWYERTDRLAPPANDCPELEAFLSALYRDLFDPTLRKKISSNLTEGQRDFIKTVKREYPKENLRIRREDKGHRFVIADGDAEDELIEDGLKNRERFDEVDESPLEDYNVKIERWAAEGLRSGELSDQMYRFVTNTEKPSASSRQAEELHLANPKPQYKTHKTDDQGQMVDPVPIRTITVGTGTPVHKLSKLCSVAIEHLPNKQNLPRMNKSTRDAVRRLIFINENMTPLTPESVLAFSDIKSMYDNVDCDEAVAEVKSLLEKNPSPLGLSSDYIAAGLKICLECNCVQFKESFYIPCKGCAQGTCHACTFTDIWVGKVVKKHLETSNIDSVFYSIYRDDGLDILKRGLEDQAAYQQHLDGLHPNLSWDLNCAKEGGFLDLFIMIKEGRVEYKTYTKTPPLYLNKISCHDPKVFQSIPTGVGYRLRLTNSTNETFRENVELYSRAMATSGYDYQTVKRELMKFEKIDPIELAKRDKQPNKRAKPGCKAYFNSPYDPRMTHPRSLISKNYELLARSEKAKGLFPRENLIASSKRLKNLGEILSPTVQKTGRNRAAPRLDGGGHGGGGDAQGLDEEANGSFHCKYHKKTGKCDLCSKIIERREVTSTHFKVKHSIAGHNVHLPASQTMKTEWFTYLEECIHPENTFQYVGSTDSMTHRWANTKSRCKALAGNPSLKAGTGLERHFQNGCSEYDGPRLGSVRVTLLEKMRTSKEKLKTANHKPGAGCRCTECGKLKQMEDKWICRLGTFHGEFGLNTRDEIVKKNRVVY